MHKKTAMLKSNAIFSKDRIYRYSLIRIWDSSKPLLHISGLNPSTADETEDDPTIRREIQFAVELGYGGLCKTNAFAFRATQPRVMKRQANPVGAENDRYILEASKKSGMSIAAWGIHGNHHGRDQEMYRLHIDWYCFGFTKGGHPRHPLYLPKTIRPIRVSNARA